MSKELETNGFGKKILWVREIGVMLLTWELGILCVRGIVEIKCITPITLVM